MRKIQTMLLSALFLLMPLTMLGQQNYYDDLKKEYAEDDATLASIFDKAAGEAPGQPNRTFADGFRHYINGDYQGAIELFKSAKEGKINIANYYLGRIYEQMQDEKEAFLSYEQTDQKYLDTKQRYEELKQYYEDPQFPGGIQGLRKFLSDNLKYPELCERAGLKGKVVVSFVIEKDGTVDDIKIAKGDNPGFNQEAIRVTKLLPQWIPGKFKGKPIRVKYALPYIWKL